MGPSPFKPSHRYHVECQASRTTELNLAIQECQIAALRKAVHRKVARKVGPRHQRKGLGRRPKARKNVSSGSSKLTDAQIMQNAIKSLNSKNGIKPAPISSVSKKGGSRSKGSSGAGSKSKASRSTKKQKWAAWRQNF